MFHNDRDQWISDVDAQICPIMEKTAGGKEHCGTAVRVTDDGYFLSACHACVDAEACLYIGDMGGHRLVTEDRDKVECQMEMVCAFPYADLIVLRGGH